MSRTTSEYLDTAAFSDDRRAAYCRLLCEIESSLGPMPVLDIAAVARFLDAKHAAGIAPNSFHEVFLATIRKHVGMINAFYSWMYENGSVSAEVYLRAALARSNA